jgi:hypothetical protein
VLVEDVGLIWVVVRVVVVVVDSRRDVRGRLLLILVLSSSSSSSFAHPRDLREWGSRNDTKDSMLFLK